jgi:uncharacterized membrane protein YhaH (DUF805 family)
MYRYGRINRATYFLCLAILSAVWAAAVASQVRVPGEIIALVISIPRLHDIGKSAWWAGAAFLVELVVVFGALPFAISGHNVGVIEIAGGMFALVLWGLMIWLGCVRGQEGVNKYGEPPPAGVSFKTYRMTKTAAEAEADAF